MEEQEETVQIHIKSIDKTVDFPVRSSSFCDRCKGTGVKGKDQCPYCCGSGSVKMLDCIRCNGTKQIENGGKCNICKGEGILSEVKTREFLEARQFCEGFQKAPAVTILIGLACLIALGICAYVVSGYAFIDLRLLKTWGSYIALMVGFGAGFYLLICLNKMYKGSYLPSLTKFLISFAVIALAVAAVVIPGPVAGRYNWIERQAKNIVNDGVSDQGFSCEKVKVTSTDRNVYHGIATISNGQEIEIDIYYLKANSYGRKISYSIEVRPVKKAGDPEDE